MIPEYQQEYYMPRRHTPVRHIRYSSEMPCQRKRRFASEAKALETIESAEIMGIEMQLKTYLCPYCHGWHLSSIKDDSKRSK